MGGKLHPEYELFYFELRGLGEQIRLLLIDNGIPFKDTYVAFDEWRSKYKADMPMGQLPVLIDDGTKIGQSGAIMRHLARKHDMYGHSFLEAALVDMVYEGVKDLTNRYLKMIYTEFEKKDDYIKDVMPGQLEMLEKALKEKEGPFVLGKEQLSFADYFLFEQLDAHSTLSPGCLDQYPALRAQYAAVQARPNLQAHLTREARKTQWINGNGKQ